MYHHPDFPKVLYRYPDMAGRPFLPSNGTEGMMFTGEFCDTCKHQHPDPNNSNQCDDVLMLSMMGE